MDKPGGLRPSTPGGHIIISLAWIAAFVLAIASPWYPAVLPVSVALALGAFAVYLVRHVRFLRRLGAVERALARGDLATARAIAAPLLDRFPGQPLALKAAADVLYATGDPLSRRASTNAPRSASPGTATLSSDSSRRMPR